MKIELTVEDVLKNDIVYMSVKEVMKMTGVSKATVHNHIKNGIVDCYVFKSKVFFTPDEAKKYKRLYESGVLGRDV